MAEGGVVKIATIIPYFQRERGLLEHAVASIAAQRLDPGVSVSIIVVDDGSPSPAREERFPELPAHVSLTIIEQANGGVGAARNKGLESVPADVDHIAFLDSDDTWAPDHLNSALAAMAGGADFYFDNNMVDAHTNGLGYTRYMRDKYGQVDVTDRSIHFVPPQEMFNAIVRECVPHTSQVVFGARAHGGIRFETQLKRAGEDMVFWLTLAGRAKLVAYSLAIMGQRGVGVSIYQETLAWDSPNSMSRLADELLMREIIRNKFALDKTQLAALSSDQREVFQHYVFLCLRNARRQPRQILASLRRVMREYADFWRAAPGAVAGVPAYMRRMKLENAAQTAAA